MRINPGKAVLAGLVGTLVMTAIGVWVAPMMGMPVFSGSLVMAMGSLVGHLVYGATIGTIYGAGEARAVSRQAVA